MTKIIFPNLGFEIDPPSQISDLFESVKIPAFLGNIHFYGMIIAFGLMLAVIYGMRRSKQFGLKSDDILDGVLWIVPVAIICARLYYCISEWDVYGKNPISMLYIWKGGMAIYGSVIGAAICVVIFSRIKKVSLCAVLDLVALSFLIGQAIGRWGNFMNREAFGCYSDGLFAMRISESYLRIPADATEAFLAQVDHLRQMAVEGGYAGMIQVHPTFLYESVWNAVGFAALHFLSKRRQYDGQIALGYAAWYGLGRALIEGLRMDSLGTGDIRYSQVLAAASCVVAVAVLIWQATRSHDKKNLFVNRVAAAEEQTEE